MSSLAFGFSLLPTRDLGLHAALVDVAEEEGLDLVGIQDHPYATELIDTFVLAATLFARTERLTIFPDVATLPLRPPAMLAKTAAALDVVSGGRFELGLGAGGVWHALVGMGVERRTPGQANAALEEAVTIMRALWTPSDRPVVFAGEHYRVTGTPAGPPPAHPIGVWLGSQGPRALALAGRIADGWAAPIAPYLPYEQWSRAHDIIDDAALAAGRKPTDVRRIAQLVGTITDRPGGAAAEALVGAEPVRGTPDEWQALIRRLATEQPFTSFVLWPERQSVEQVRRFARDVAAPLRAQG